MMAQKQPSKPTTKQAPKVTVIRGKAAQAEMAAMQRAAKAQADVKGKKP